MAHYTVPARRVLDLYLESTVDYVRPVSQAELEATFTSPSGTSLRVPGFASRSGWHVRFAGSEVGEYSFTTSCTDESNAGLHGVSGTVKVTARAGPTGNPLYDHGRVRVHESRAYFCHEDGTPYFWLADDWWHGTSKRLDWPEGFRELLADRTQKGFSMINMAIGLACDVSKEQLPGANEAGLPWGDDYEEINPDWFDMADLRVTAIAEAGLVPGIFFSWGYWIMLLNEERIRRHVRYCVARWGAYPVVYSLCGELMMPMYDTPPEEREEELAEQQRRWINIARYLRTIDGYGTPVSAHPFGQAEQATAAIPDRSLIDYNMLQGGHGDVRVSLWSLARTERILDDPGALRPIVMGETCFEGMFNRTSPFGQRLLFWGQFLNGLRGICYGAEGIWQMNTREEPLGPSPHGQAWSYIPWREAMHFGGSLHMGIGKKMLERFEWWRFERHREWVEIPERAGSATESYAASAGIPREIRVIYFGQYARMMPPKILGLEPNVTYAARWFDPITGRWMPYTDIESIPVEPDHDGTWVVPCPPVMQDWVLVLEAR